MMAEFHAIVLGAVQGLTEFLPVSSSAHLVILPWLLAWQDPGLAFDVALHLGTLLALLMYYWQEWLRMAASIRGSDPYHRRLLVRLIIASLPGAIIGLAFEKQAETIFRAPLLIAVAMALLGSALWIFDSVMPKRRTIGEMTYLDAIVVGLSQAFAIVPGVSRSGATITMGRIVGLERGEAAKFSFLMATPIIAGAGLIEGRRLVEIGLSRGIWAGFAASAIFGLLAIAGLIRFVRTRTYAPFAWYRFLAAAVIIAVFLARA